jgi:hypothetical protein
MHLAVKCMWCRQHNLFDSCLSSCFLRRRSLILMKWKHCLYLLWCVVSSHIIQSTHIGALHSHQPKMVTIQLHIWFISGWFLSCCVWCLSSLATVLSFDWPNCENWHSNLRASVDGWTQMPKSHFGSCFDSWIEIEMWECFLMNLFYELFLAS